MAINEGTRQDGMFIVQSLVPDICKTPMGPTLVPVPYPIIGFLQQSIRTSANVNFAGVPAYMMNARVPTVVGDEPGVGGGVISNVFKGFCRPITFSPTVKVNGHNVNHHQMTMMWMNCAGPEGPGNTVGIVRYLGPMKSANVSPAGTIPPPDPPVMPEIDAEGGLSGLLKSVGGVEGVIGAAKQAYALATTDWSNPGSVLGAIGGVAGMAGFGDIAKAASVGQQAYNLATADWSNPGAVMGAAAGLAGAAIKSGGGSPGGGGGKPSGGLPPGVVMGRGCF